MEQLHITTTIVTIIFAVLFAAVVRNFASDLPEARRESKKSFEEVMISRRSVREFTDDELTEEHIAQLCFAAQGITEPDRKLRTAPSAGAIYPLTLYVVNSKGVSVYDPEEHNLTKEIDADVQNDLQEAALDQRWVGDAPTVFVITANVTLTAQRYGQRAERYVYIEVGHVAQNLLLQAESLDLGAVPVGAFEDERVDKILQLPEEQSAVYLIPVGHPATRSSE